MATTPTQQPTFPADLVWERLDPTIPHKGDWLDFRHRNQGEFLHELAKYSTFDLGLSHVGLSEEGRVLHTLRFGTGKRKVFVWARQHGDESDCSAALAMALCELVLHGDEPHYALIRERLELGIFPMVNPDGVARFTRRNAQGIDINRDAVAGATPEGRALHLIRESLKPEFCFNLHDMNPRKSTANAERNLVALAFQAGPFEPRDIDNDVRLKAKQVIGIMADSAAPHAAGHLARYEADYMHRAFGDTMMRLGVSSILIEAGGWYPEKGGDTFVRRLFALTLLRGLYAIAVGEDEPASGVAYDKLPFDSSRLYSDIVLEKGLVLNGCGSAPFAADVAVSINPVVGRSNEPLTRLGAIENLGDLEDNLALQRLANRDAVLMPGFVAVAPHLQFDRDRPTIAEVAPFIKAGITTLACGFGPFGSNRAREQWLETVATQPPPINIIAFERVGSIREIRMRHGMTELAGLLVQDLEISAEDLLNFMHLFHPAHHSAIEAQFAGRSVGLDLFFQGAASPSSTHLHLHLSPSDPTARRTPLRPEELRLIVDEFLRSPSQITLAMDATEGGFDWLPFMVGYGGLSHGRQAEPWFLGTILKHYKAVDSGGVVGALNMLTLSNARAFRLGNAGKVEIGQRADLVAFDRGLLAGGANSYKATPKLVLLNGHLAYTTESEISEQIQGAWHFASAPMAR